MSLNIRNEEKCIQKMIDWLKQLPSLAIFLRLNCLIPPLYFGILMAPRLNTKDILMSAKTGPSSFSTVNKKNNLCILKKH